VGRICRKGRFKAWSERKSEGVMDDESGESMELMEEVPLNAMQPNNIGIKTLTFHIIIKQQSTTRLWTSYYMKLRAAHQCQQLIPTLRPIIYNICMLESVIKYSGHEGSTGR